MASPRTALPAPEENRLLWPLGHRIEKQTGCGGWVFVLGGALAARSLSLALQALFSESRKRPQGQVNDGRSFFLFVDVLWLCSVCVRFFGLVTVTPTHEGNALASLGRCPPSRSIETPFSSAALCRTRLPPAKRAALGNEATLKVSRQLANPECH